MKTTHSFILCATDFSPRASNVALAAAKLALRSSEKLLLVHATDNTASAALAILNRRLENDAAELRKCGADVEPLLLRGARPSEALVACIRERKPSLVVVGGRVKGPMDRWALGSFSEKVAETSPVPTLVVRNPAVFADWDWMKSRLTILLALDFSSSSDVVLRWARQFLRVGPCDFVACHVNARMPAPDENVMPAAPRNPEALQNRLERELRRKVRDQLGEDAVPMVVRPNFGDPGSAIVDIADEKNVQLIAVGTHQRQGIHRLAQFSVSRDILHQATANVICVPVTTKFDPREAHVPEFRRVLVATDFSELGNTAVPFAYGACAPGGLVKIVHVVTRRQARGRDGAGWSSDLRGQLRELVPHAAGTSRQPPEVQVLIDDDIAGTICAEAEKFGADLVCLASHGLGASRALHGSVTKAVLKQIGRPLLVIRRPE